MLLEDMSRSTQTLYVSRPVLNAWQIRQWAKEQGFSSILSDDELHVTIAFSKSPVCWDDVEESPDSSVVVTGGERAVAPLGDKGAVVIRFDSDELQARWREFREAGCSWDWPSYKPHVTITYKGTGKDLDKVQPYMGPIVLGPEKFAEVNSGWSDEIKEERLDEAVYKRGGVDHDARSFGIWLGNTLWGQHRPGREPGILNYEYDDNARGALRYRMIVDHEFLNFVRNEGADAIRNYGWHLTAMMKKGRKGKRDIYQIVFEPILTAPVPRASVFWHITPKQNVETILRDGLLPRGSRFGFSYPQPRVYLVKDRKHARQMADTLGQREPSKVSYALLRVDLRRAKGVRLHTDPELKDVAVYTTQAIPASLVSVAEDTVKPLWEGRDAPLYHGTNFLMAAQIINQDSLRAGHDGHMLLGNPEIVDGVSLSRDIHTARRFGPVVFELDQRALAQRYRIEPVDYFSDDDEITEVPGQRRRDDRAEAEELVIAPEISPLRRYLRAIHYSGAWVRNYPKEHLTGPMQDAIDTVAGNPLARRDTRGMAISESVQTDRDAGRTASLAYRVISDFIRELKSGEGLPSLTADLDADGTEERFEWVPVARLRYQQDVADKLPDIRNWIVAFSPDSTINARGFYTQIDLPLRPKTHVIVMRCRWSEFFTTKAMATFKHEFIHLLDHARIAKPPEHTSYDARGGVSDEWIRTYFKDPMEINAIFHDFADPLITLLDDLEAMPEDADDLLSIHGFRPLGEYVRERAASHVKFRSFMTYADDVTKRKLIRRVARLYADIERAIREIRAASAHQ